MMTLTAENVEEVLVDCLYTTSECDGETTPRGAIIVEGIVRNFGLHPERLQKHKAEVQEMLSQLPDEFNEKPSGGWSFLMACNTKDGTQWGEHRHMEALFVLAIGLGLAKWLAPRDMWKLFPGGVPYVTITHQESAT